MATGGSGATSGRGRRGGLGGFDCRAVLPARVRLVRSGCGRGVLWRWSVGNSPTFLCWTQRPFLKNLFWQLLSVFLIKRQPKKHLRDAAVVVQALETGLAAERATAGPRNRACGSSRIHQRPIWQNAVWPKKTARPPRQCIIPTGSRSPAQGRAAEPSFRAPAARKFKHRASVAGLHRSRGIDAE